MDNPILMGRAALFHNVEVGMIIVLFCINVTGTHFSDSAKNATFVCARRRTQSVTLIMLLSRARMRTLALARVVGVKHD